MSDGLPREEAALDELAAFYSTHDVSEEIAGGQVVTPEPMVTTSLRLPSAVVDALRAEAAERGIRYTSLLREVLVAHVTEPELSYRALRSRVDALEREHERRLRRLENAQRVMSELASDSGAQYVATPRPGEGENAS